MSRSFKATYFHQYTTDFVRADNDIFVFIKPVKSFYGDYRFACVENKVSKVNIKL